MHLPDGLLPAIPCVAGYAVTAAATAASLAVIRRGPDPSRSIPKASIFTAAFFVASWIHIPVPPISVHLTLIGLLGAVLGPFAFLAILIGLFFQAVVFQHGGLTTLGLNAALMGIPAVLVGWAFRTAAPLWRRGPAWAAVAGCCAGVMGIALAAVGVSLVLVWAVPAQLDPTLRAAGVTALTLGHAPLAAIEGVFTALVVAFLIRVQPGLLER
jgi:cobalt/nickel transport system permease protein